MVTYFFDCLKCGDENISPIDSGVFPKKQKSFYDKSIVDEQSYLVDVFLDDSNRPLYPQVSEYIWKFNQHPDSKKRNRKSICLGVSYNARNNDLYAELSERTKNYQKSV